MPATKERGEDELVLAGTKYRLRPSHVCISAIEEQTLPLMELVRLANSGRLTNAQLGIIVAELIQAGADEGDRLAQNVDPERIAELIFEEDGPDGFGGVAYVTPKVSLVLLSAATGGRKASGEAKAAPAIETNRSAGVASQGS